MDTLNAFEKGVLTAMLLQMQNELELPKINIDKLDPDKKWEYNVKMNILQKAIIELLPKELK